MELVVILVRFDNEKFDKVVFCEFYEVYKIIKYGLIVEERFKKFIVVMSFKMGIVIFVLNIFSEIV